MGNYLNLSGVVLFPATKISLDFLLQSTDNYVPSLNRIKLEAAGCLSFFCLSLGVFSFHYCKLKWWLDYLFTNTFSVPEKQSFLSTYFGLTHVFALPLGRC
jgi:hypothetical protein